MRVCADTNVLFPFSVMDLLPALTENSRSASDSMLPKLRARVRFASPAQ